MNKSVRARKGYTFGRVTRSAFLNISRHHMPGHTRQQILDKSTHPLHLQCIRQAYTEHKSKPLWWRVANPAADLKAVVDSSYRRRFREAFKESLASRGIDHDGRALGPPARSDPSKNALHSPGWKSPPGTKILQGTVLIIPVENSILQPHREIREDLDAEIDYLLSAIGPQHRHKEDREAELVSSLNGQILRVSRSADHLEAPDTIEQVKRRHQSSSIRQFQPPRKLGQGRLGQ